MTSPAARRLVAGVDSSTQSCKVVIRDAATGELVRGGSAPHPDGTEVHPDAWWSALDAAVEAAGGLADVAAVSVAAQQHGLVCLDADGAVVRPALLWNDTRSADAADALVAELGAEAWAEASGSLPVASFTVTKLRWLAEHEPEAAARVAAVCLPHDWLTWRLTGGSGLSALTTDRSDASGTGYWSPQSGQYRPELLERAFGRVPVVPRVAGPAETVGVVAGTPILVGPGAGDNAAAALGLGVAPGDVVVSIGTSGTVFAVAPAATADPSGTIAGFADATGRFLPLVCTLNAARVLEAAAAMLGVGLDEFSRLALAGPPGADGLTVIPYLEGERTPNRPGATASVHGWRPGTSTPAHFARAAVEGMLCGLADGLDTLASHVDIRRVLLIGGGARSEAVRRIAPTVLGVPVRVPPPSEYVADGAARQAAWVLGGLDAPPPWSLGRADVYEAPPVPGLRARYADHRDEDTDR